MNNFVGRRALTAVMISSSIAIVGCSLGLSDVNVPSSVPDAELSPDAMAPRQDGFVFCRNLEISARSNEIGHRTLGWVLGTTALVSAGAGVGLLATDQPVDQTRKDFYKVGVVALPLAAALFAYFSQDQFTMGANSGALAKAASYAEMSPHPDADGGVSYTQAADSAKDTCNTAIGVWDAAQSQPLSGFSEAVGKLTEAQKANAQATSKLNTAQSLADHFSAADAGSRR